MSSRTETKRIYWRYLLVAFLLASGLWYTLNAKDQVERMIEVRLDYRGLPPNLVVTDGQLNKISVRVRGPMELLRAGAREDPSYTVDLSGLTPGDNIIPFAFGSSPTRAFEVLEIIPSRMILHVERIKEVKLPVKVRFRASPVSSSLRLTDLAVTPATVTIRGPASAVDPVKEIWAEIPADVLGEDKEITDDVALLAPAGVEIVPRVVKVQRTLDVRRRTVTLQRDIVAEDESVTVQPSHCTLTVSVPRSLARDGNYLAQFQVSLPADADPPDDGTPIRIQLQASTPQGGRIVRVSPETVTLVRSPEGNSGSSGE